MEFNTDYTDFVNTIFSEWFSVCAFDPDSDKDCNEYYHGNLLSWHASAWETCKQIVKLVKQYNSPYLAFVVLRASISSFRKDLLFTIDEIIEGKHKKMTEVFRKIYYDDKSEEIVNGFAKMVSRLAAKPNLIGDANINEIIECVPEVIKKVEKLNFHPLYAGNKPLGEVEIRNKIRTYSDMGKCLLDIEENPEGLYLCYINPKDSIDGYFSVIYKSNGNILSVDDQIKEAYLGQHSVERIRNARYTEDKATEIFPYYLMFDFSKPDAKGYYTEYKLKGDFTLNEMPIEAVFPVIIAMFLILKKYCGKSLKSEETFLSSHLIGGAAQNLIETKALTLRKDSALVLHAETKIELTREEILRDCRTQDEPDDFYYTWKPAVVNYLKKLWCDNDIISSVPERSDYSYILNNKENLEMLANKDTLKENALFIMRKEMKDKIQRRIEDYFIEHDFGNEGVRKWREMVQAHKDIILSKIGNCTFIEEDDRKGVCIGYEDKGKVSQEYWRKQYFPFNDMNNYKVDTSTYRNRAYLKDDMGICRYTYTFWPKDWKSACEFIGINEEELPKEMKGWTLERNEKYGNSILDMTDYMEDLNNGYMCFYKYYFGMCVRPSEYLKEKLTLLKRKHEYNIVHPDDYAIYDRQNPFAFSIAISSRGLKKLYPGAEIRRVER